MIKLILSRTAKITIKSINYITGNQFVINYSIPKREGAGYPRKALIYFQEKNGYILGIEEFGKGIPESKIYYHIQANSKKMHN